MVEHQRTGLIFAKGDHVAMAQFAIRLLREPDLAQTLIANARAECEQYQWSAVRNQWLALYRERIDER